MIWDFDYASIGSITTLLEDNGLSMTKKFGQNFLISMPSLERIVSLAGITEGTRVWEVGPGIGALTTKLLKAGARVTAFEIDHGFCRILREQAYHDCPSFRLVEGDALKTWKDVFQSEGAPDVICANLPYNVGSVLIASFIESRCLPKRMVYTLQSEVVQRICAKKGDDEWGGFSILTSADYDNREAMKLKAGCFYPMPNVDSSVVVMEKKAVPFVEDDFAKRYFDFVRAAFSQRRKTLKNNLKSIGISSDAADKALSDLGKNLSARAEELDAQELLKLCRSVYQI